jgi:MtrB/PioB family decaheme-associated outer membrane protein
MKRRSKVQFMVALSTCVLLQFSNPSLADQPAYTPDTSNWKCRLCPVSGGWLGEWDLGLIFVDDATPKFADYRGLDDDGIYLDTGGKASYRDDSGVYFNFFGRNVGLDSRALETRGGKQGSYELRAHYSEIPRYLGNETRTPFVGVGTDTLVLPASWQGAPHAGDDAGQSMTPATLRSKRKTFGGGLTVKMGRSWKVEADIERQAREGTSAFSGGLFAINAAIFPAPVDFTTDLFNMGLEYKGNRAQLLLEFSGSDFDNDNNSVTWDNPFTIGFGDDVSRSALEPDNEYYQFSLAGAVRFSPRFRISAKASIGEAEQNQAFLPYSVNPAHDELVLPRSSLGGKIETSMLNLSARLYIVLADRLDLTAQYKINERDNKTPVTTYTPILLEVFPADPVSNRPYGYERSQGKVELRFRPNYSFRLNAGLKKDTLERTFQSVRETEEDTYWGEMQFNAAAWANIRLKLDHMDRDATPYEQLDDNGRAENPLMRKFHLAERDRERATIELDLSPIDRLGLNLSYYTTDDDYKASVIGLTASEEQSYTLDLNFSPSKNTNLYAFVTEDKIDSEMSGATDIEAVPWRAYTEDSILTWGMGFSGQLNDRISCGLDYISSDSDGKILTDSGAGEAPFPVLETELQNLRLYVHYKVNDRWNLNLDAYREKYDTSDWLVDGIGPYDINGVLTMGQTSPDYDVNVVRLLARISF